MYASGMVASASHHGSSWCWEIYFLTRWDACVDKLKVLDGRRAELNWRDKGALRPHVVGLLVVLFGLWDCFAALLAHAHHRFICRNSGRTRYTTGVSFEI
jgi:hypothetical protein